MNPDDPVYDIKLLRGSKAVAVQIMNGYAPDGIENEEEYRVALLAVSAANAVLTVYRDLRDEKILRQRTNGKIQGVRKGGEVGEHFVQAVCERLENPPERYRRSLDLQAAVLDCAIEGARDREDLCLEPELLQFENASIAYSDNDMVSHNKIIRQIGRGLTAKVNHVMPSEINSRHDQRMCQLIDPLVALAEMIQESQPMLRPVETHILLKDSFIRLYKTGLAQN